MTSPLLLITAMAAAHTWLPNQPVSALDLQRYVGPWHEIAHLPMFFQRKCKDRITATYTLRVDGRIDVRNACRTKADMQDVSQGVAKPVERQPGALKIRFAPGWLSWLPWVWADYWVIELDADYRWAVIGGPGRKYMWVLSRDPQMSRALFGQLVEHARQRGYPVHRLVMAASLE